MSKPSFESPPPIGRRYQAAGRRLALHRTGEGGPAVVFLPGAGLIGLDYLNIHEEVSRFTTSVIYDRGGTGWSDAARLPRSAAEVAGELRSLLVAADVPAPYVLVGHSLGGAYARRYTQRFPDDIAGVLFLDPAHEAYGAEPKQPLIAQLRQGLALVPALLNLKKFYRPKFEAMFASWPDGLRSRLVDYHLASWGKGLEEARNLRTEILDEIRLGGPMPDAPVIMLTAMGIDPFMAPFMAEPYLRELNERKNGYYTAFARSLQRGEHRALSDAGHSTLHTDRPDAVVAAIAELVDAAREDARSRSPTKLAIGASRD
ncbi:MAG: alpha/beta fold hydrolase [Caulobacterales bacterium]